MTENTPQTGRIVTCPQCKKTLAWSSDNPYRPFCSERCRLIDLGDWAAENHRIAGEPAQPWELNQPPAED